MEGKRPWGAEERNPEGAPNVIGHLMLIIIMLGASAMFYGLGGSFIMQGASGQGHRSDLLQPGGMLVLGIAMVVVYTLVLIWLVRAPGLTPKCPKCGQPEHDTAQFPCDVCPVEEDEI